VPAAERATCSTLVVLHLACELAVGDRLVAQEVDVLDADLRTFRDVEREVDGLRVGAHRLDLGLDGRVLVALVAVHSAHDRRDVIHEARVDERVEVDLQVLLLQLLFDLRLLDFLRSDVVDDLDALPFFHVVDDQLADHAVREAVVLDVDDEVVEEVRRIQPLEVADRRLLGLVVPRNPDVSDGRLPCSWM
jgi:hypothetical protein